MRGVMKKLADLVSIACLFLFCGGVETTIIRTQAYSFSNANPAPKLTICISDGKPVIDYTGNVEDEFGKGDKNDLIWAFFKGQLSKDILHCSIFSSVDYDEVSSQPSTQQQTIKVNNMGDVAFSLPSEGAKIECKATTPDVVLFLDGITITSKLDISGSPGHYVGNMYMAGSFNSEKDLVYEAKMILWDNNAKKVVSYGLVHVVDSNKFAVSKEDWLSLTEEFTGKILEGTPFKKL
jgi:hypothetical protein